MATALKKLGYAEFLKFPDDGNRHEIIEGEWFMTPPPTTGHQAVVGKLLRVLGNHAESKDLGRVFTSPIGVVLGRHDIVQPDVLFIMESRVSIVKNDGIHGAPDLVVEVLSPSTADYDRREKLAAYQRLGVREYWIVDPIERTVEIREFGRVRRMRAYKEGQSFSSSLLPGLTIRVDDLFRRLP